MPHLEHPGDVWGVLIETSLKESVVMLVAFIDGSNGLYFGTGDDAVNGSSIPKAVDAARDLVAISGSYADRMSRAVDYPLPAVGQVRFSLLTGSSLLISPEIPHADLIKGQHAFSPLFNKAQVMLVELRKDHLR